MIVLSTISCPAEADHPVTDQEPWSDLLGNPAAYPEEVYKLSMAYIIMIC
jgi:hypothetical protein